MLVKAYGAYAADKPLESLEITRRATGAHDVQIDIAYCGICHSDLHQVRAEWEGTQYPCVPGHEIVGRVAAVGAHVQDFKPGDLVGVGCIVDSCKHCAECADGFENYCDGMVGTYNAPTAVAPLLCAGITTYSPLRHWQAGPGKKVGVVGIGGLGHMGIKLAHAMGAHVVAFTTSESKREAARELGADEVVVSRNQRVQLHHEAPFAGRLDDRRHSRDAGDAGLLRAARHRGRYRNGARRRDQRRLRAHAQGRRQVPLRDRQRHAGGLMRMPAPDTGMTT